MSKNRIVLLACLTCVLMLSAAVSSAKESHGVSFPDTVSVNGTPCVLIGVGTRKILCFNIYMGAVYLEKPSQSEREVVSSKQPKHMIMHILYDEIRVDQIIEHTMNGFRKNAGWACSKLRDKIKCFHGFFTKPLKKGDSLRMTYIPDKGMEVVIQGEYKGIIEGHDFMEAVALNWLGPHPPSKRFKREILGH